MLLRRLYQIIGTLVMLLSLFVLIMAFVNISKGLSLGLALAAFLATIGFSIYKIASGPSEVGNLVLGVEEKAFREKEKSLAKKAKS